MKKCERLSAYNIFMNKWGIDAQIMMCIEEMSELTKELCKLHRFSNDEGVINNIKEELADVQNCIEQLCVYYGEKDIENIRDSKINRTLNKINKN